MKLLPLKSSQENSKTQLIIPVSQVEAFSKESKALTVLTSRVLLSLQTPVPASLKSLWELLLTCKSSCVFLL